jgi:hypothetical protein
VRGIEGVCGLREIYIRFKGHNLKKETSWKDLNKGVNKFV